MYFKQEEGFGLFIIIIGIVFVLALVGTNLTFFGGRSVNRKMDELSRTAAYMGSSMAVSGIQSKVGRETFNDPVWATFFQDVDINDDGIIARDGEVDSNKNGKFDIGVEGVGRNEIDDDCDGIIDELPGEIAPTEDDANGNRKEDLPDGILEDAYGTILTDGSGPIKNEDVGGDGVPSSSESGYDPVHNPDPAGDDYHPISNETGTEGNGRFDTGETDFNGNGKLDTIEHGLQKWLRYSKRIQMGTFTAGLGAPPRAFYGNIRLRALDANSKINLNGTDAVLAARLLNNLLRVIEFIPKTVGGIAPEQDNPLTPYVDERGDGKDSDSDGIIDDGTFLGLNSRGIEYDCGLDATIVNNPLVNQKNNVGTTTARADDADAVLIIKFRNSLPDKQFSFLEQLLDVVRPGTATPSACTSPMLTRRAGRIFDRENVNRDPNQTEDQAIFINNKDEFERLKDFVAIKGWEDITVVKQDPSDQTKIMVDSRYPVGLNVASKEVLHAVLVTGVMNADTEASFAAMEPLAAAITVDRIQKPFGSWNAFEKYMDDTIGTDTAKMDPLLLRNKARLIAQLKPNTSLQRFNPNGILIRPLDKTHIGTPTAELSLFHSGYYEVDSLGIVTSTVSKSIDEDVLFQFGTSAATVAGGELGRKEIMATVKVMDILSNTAQEEFEDSGTASVFKSSRIKSVSNVSSYPENMKDTEITMGSSSSHLLSFVPTAITVDEITGNVYVGGNTDIIGIWDNKLNSIGTATITDFTGGQVSFLAIDPAFTSTDFGRLYVGMSGDRVIRVFDIMGATTSRSLIPRRRKDIEGDIAAFPKKIALNSGHKIITAITNSSERTVLEWRYPLADAEALPETDNLNTPSDETADGLDNDGDGLADDTETSSRGRPETSINDIDDDGDGEIDDSIRPKSTQPKRPDSLSKSPFVFDAGYANPAVDIVFDSNLEQYFVVGTNTITRLRDSINTHTLENVVSATLPEPFLSEAIAIDEDDNCVYVLGNSTSDELVTFSTTGTPTAFPELDRLSLGSVTTNTRHIAIDKEDDLLFVLSEGANGTITSINARNERLRIMPVSQTGTETFNASAMSIDSRRNRVYFTEGEPFNKVKVFEYKIDTAMKQTWIDGQIQLAHSAAPLGTDSAVLYRSNFHSDLNLTGTTTANRLGTGTPFLIDTGEIRKLPISNTLFAPPGTITVGLSPDGVITQTSSTAGAVIGSILSYDPVTLFGAGTITDGVDRRGFRNGAMEFWIKFPQLTCPYAVPETQTADIYDNDGDGVINDTGTDPAANPEINAENGVDDDADGFVDDVVGIGKDAAYKPDEVVLSRLLYNVQLENDIFVTKDGGNPSKGVQLSRIMGTNTPLFDDFSWTSGSTTTYTIFSKLSLKNFGDGNNDSLIDNAVLELERFSFPGTITVTGTYTTTMQSIIDEPVYPGTATYCVGTTAFLLRPGKWQNIAYNWWIKTTGSNTEVVEQKMFIDGSGTVTTGRYIGTDTSFLLGTISTRLKDLPGNLDSATATIFHIGTKIFGTGTTSSLQATIDDLTIYNGTISVTGDPKRFASAFGASISERGEPFQDFNLNFQRDASSHKFKDKNRNGLFEVGEAFDMGSATAVGYSYDSSGEFYSFYGERFVDAGTSTVPNEYELGEVYSDFNRNGKWDVGELFLDLEIMNGIYNAGVTRTDANDANRDRRLDDSGYIVRNFNTVVPKASRVGTISWTEYLPDKTDISLELTLRSLDGRILWRWLGGDGTSTSTRIDLPVPEDSILEYRANLFAVGTQTESPVIDDITVTVIKETPEIVSLIEK